MLRSDRSDRELSFRSRLATGDAALFAELVSKYRHRVAAIAGRRAPRGVEADDCIAETWLLVWENRSHFRADADGRAFEAWLSRLCRTACGRAARAARRNRTDVSIEQLPKSGRPDPIVQSQPLAINDALEYEEQHERRLDMIMKLPSRQRAVVLHRLCEGLSTRDTASLLGCSEGTVKAALYAAKRSLRARWNIMSLNNTTTSE